MQHIHIVGIAGVGMSGIARLLHHKGYTVSGCDQKASERVTALRNEGIHVEVAPQGSVCSVHTADSIIHSTAISLEHPELVTARQRDVPCYNRTHALPLVTHGMYVIAVTGTHGKTTSTALIGHLLERNGYGPNVLVGGHVRTWERNVRLGSRNILVIEADESDGSLLGIAPHVAVITNIDHDHTQTYATFAETRAAFTSFVRQLPQTSVLITSDTNAYRDELNAEHPISSIYGFSEEAQYRCTAYTPFHEGDSVSIAHETKETTLRMPSMGAHNVYNMLAAIAATDAATTDADICEHITTFPGIARRWEYKGHIQGIPVYDDYAHHPTEIHAILTMLTERGFTTPCIIFQPHRYSRLSAFWHTFIQAFTHMPGGSLYITDVYGAEEPPRYNVSALQLYQDMRHEVVRAQVSYIRQDMQHIAQIVRSKAAQHDIIITLGAGDITQLHQYI